MPKEGGKPHALMPWLGGGEPLGSTVDTWVQALHPSVRGENQKPWRHQEMLPMITVGGWTR